MTMCTEVVLATTLDPHAPSAMGELQQDNFYVNKNLPLPLLLSVQWPVSAPELVEHSCMCFGIFGFPLPQGWRILCLNIHLGVLVPSGSLVSTVSIFWAPHWSVSTPHLVLCSLTDCWKSGNIDTTINSWYYMTDRLTNQSRFVLCHIMFIGQVAAWYANSASLICHMSALFSISVFCFPAI